MLLIKYTDKNILDFSPAEWGQCTLTCDPWSPFMPGGPGLPSGPWIPISPFSPLGPGDPGRPRVPSVPLIPSRPGDPTHVQSPPPQPSPENSYNTNVHTMVSNVQNTCTAWSLPSSRLWRLQINIKAHWSFFFPAIQNRYLEKVK